MKTKSQRKNHNQKLRIDASHSDSDSLHNINAQQTKLTQKFHRKNHNEKLEFEEGTNPQHETNDNDKTTKSKKKYKRKSYNQKSEMDASDEDTDFISDPSTNDQVIVNPSEPPQKKKKI